VLVNFIAASVVVILAAVAAHSQTISGIVTDPRNAPVAGAAVILTVYDREQTRRITGVDGRFAIETESTIGLAIAVEATGFRRSILQISQLPSTDLRIVLEPASVNENVLVSITGTETRLSETPASVVALTRETLDSTAAQTLDDSLRQVAGFTLFRRSSSKTTNPTAQGANLRGVSGSGASRAAVEVDGLSLNDAFGGWTYWSRVPKIAVEQAEVLRGGASPFYGTAGLSGAVNVVTSRPTETSVFRVQASAGSQNTYDGSFLASATLRGWELSLAGETFQTGGYVPVVESERGLADTRATSRHNNGILTIGRNFAAGGLDGRAFVRGNIFSERRDNGTSLTYNKTYFRQAAGGIDLGNDRIGSFTIRGFIEAQVYDQSFSAVAADRNSETLSRLQRVPSQAAGGSVQWSKAISTHTITAAAQYRQVRGFSDEVGYFGGRPTSLLGAGGKESSIAVSFHDLWQATNRLTISFGGRVDRWEDRDALSTSRSLTSGAVSVTEYADRSASAFSPRIAALFRLDGGVSLYGSYSRSFRAPTLNELYRGFRVGDTVTLANESLVAEIADTAEGGASYTAGRLSLRGNVFYTRVSDPVVSVTQIVTPSLITRRRENVGSTRTAGLELDAEFRLHRDLRLSAGYLFADSRISSFPANPGLEGNFLPQIPKQQLNFQLFYRPQTKFAAGIQARLSDGQFEDDLNTRRLGSYFTMDATASYRLPKNLEIFAAAENIFNSRYDIGLTPVRTVAAPAFVRVGVRYRVGGR
jgi:outer membrane receptor protein involved in Fe transport